MRQVLQDHRTGSTVVRVVPVPPCPPGGVLVHTAFSAISSGTERARVALSQKSLLGKVRERPDLVREVVARARRDGVGRTMQAVQRRLDEAVPVGYSCAGTVVEAGEHVRGLLPGDHVACAGATAGHAEFVAVPGNLCARVPAGVPLQSAAVTAIASIALHAIRLAEVQVGARVAVIGCGLVGQLALRLLRAAGAETFALDIDARRIDQVLAGGADHAAAVDPGTARRIAAQTAGMGVDAVVVCAAAETSRPLLLAAEIARDRAAIVLVGSVPIAFPRSPLYEKELSFRVCRSYGPGRYDSEYEERGLDYPIGYVRWTEARNMQAVLRMQAAGLVSFTDLVETVPLTEAPAAYARLTDPAHPPPPGVLVLAHRADKTTAPDAAEGPIHLVTSVGVTASPTEAGAAAPSTRGTGRLPVRIGLIGPGGFARGVLVPALQAAGAELAVVGGGTGPSASAATRNGSFARTAPDAAAVIADPAVDAVVIATRHVSHASLVTEALAAGKHVFCEKPLALTSDELDGVRRAARTAPGTLLVGFNRRFSPLLREMAVFLRASDEPMTLTYRVSAGELGDAHWTHDLAQGGGRALGEVCHFIDALSFLAGRPVAEVHVAGRAPPTRPVQGYDNLVLMLRFAGGSIASLAYASSGSPRVPKERLEGFCGTRTAMLDDYRGLELFNGRHRHRHRRRLRRQDKGHREEAAAFVRAARTGEAAVRLDEIENVTLGTLAIVESLRTGRPVRLS